MDIEKQIISSRSPRRNGQLAGLLVVGLFAISIVWLAGCQDLDSLSVETLEMDRIGWDSLDVSARFHRDAPLSAGGPVAPDLITVTLFDEAYDTLYVGGLGRFAVFDENLGNEERLLLEVCGYFGEQVACDQQSLQASPKRATADWKLTFPQDTTRIEYDRAYVESRVVLERQAFGSDVWQRFEPSSRKEIYLDAWVLGHADSKLRLPVVRRGQRFILPRYTGYRDFRYAIQSSMLDADSAAVRFELHVRLSRQAVLIDTKDVVLRQKSVSEREAEVQALVERAGAQVLDALEGFLGVRRAYVFINDWNYTPLDRRYTAEFELHWQEGFRGSWSDLTGVMQVRSDGDLGTFTFMRGSERGEERWVQRVGKDVMELEHLYPEQVVLPPEPEEETESDRRRGRQ